jgi:hypothetical protein
MMPEMGKGGHDPGEGVRGEVRQLLGNRPGDLFGRDMDGSEMQVDPPHSILMKGKGKNRTRASIMFMH